MITKPPILDETGQKILAAISRIKTKIQGTSSSAITPGSAASSGTEPVMQDDTGRSIISALNDLGDAVPVEIQYLSGVTGNIQTQLNGKKPLQAAVPDAGVGTNTANAFVNSLSQDENGVITYTKAQMQAASTDQRGVVTTGAQAFAGIKTFNNYINITKTPNGSNPGFYFQNEGESIGRMFSTVTTTPAIYFQGWSYNDDGTRTENYETFYLPAINKNRTSNDSYRIITTKNPGYLYWANVPVSASSSTATTPTFRNLTIGGTSAYEHIKFSRTAYNYVTVPFDDGGSLCLGKGASTNDGLYIWNSTEYAPNYTNTFTLGTSSKRWKSVYIGASDSYGDANLPIYWDNGVPKAVNYHFAPLGALTDANNTELYGNTFRQANTCANLPTSAAGTYYFLICFGNAQMAYRFGSNGPDMLYARYFTNNRWYAWKGVALS